MSNSTNLNGLILFVPLAIRPFESIRTRLYFRLVILPLLVCVVAQVVSLPLCAHYFQRLPLVSFLSNLVIVPLVSIDVIGEMIYDPEVQDAVRLGCYKAMTSTLVIAESHKTEDITVHQAPVILPARVNSEGRREVDLSQLDSDKAH